MAEVHWMNLYLPSNFLKASFQRQQDILKAYADATTRQTGHLDAELVLHPKQLKHLTNYAKLRQDKRSYDAALQLTQEDIAAQGQNSGGQCAS